MRKKKSSLEKGISECLWEKQCGGCWSWGPFSHETAALQTLGQLLGDGKKGKDDSKIENTTSILYNVARL